MTPPRQDARRLADLAIEGHRLRYACWIEPDGHVARLGALAGLLGGEIGLDVGRLLAEVQEGVAAGDEECELVADAAAEIIRLLHEAITYSVA